MREPSDQEPIVFYDEANRSDLDRNGGGGKEVDFFKTVDTSEEIDGKQNRRQKEVWPLTQFFLFPFGEKSLICLEGKSMTPHRGDTILFRSSQQLPRLRLGPSKGFLS